MYSIYASHMVLCNGGHINQLDSRLGFDVGVGKIIDCSIIKEVLTIYSLKFEM